MTEGSGLEAAVASRHGEPVNPEPGGAVPWHPFLFMAASVLALLSRNLNQAFISHAISALAGALAFALVIYLIVAAIRRRFDAHAAVIASIWVVGCMFHAGLFKFMRSVDGSYATVWSLPVAILAMATLTAIVVRLPSVPIRVAHLVLTGIAVVMLATPAWQIAAHEWRSYGARSAYDSDQALADISEFAQRETPAIGNERPPDIYYFVFDRLASVETLARDYGVDISGTRNFLEQRGFRVVRTANSNYHRTAHSLASTFYMDYLDLLSRDDRVAGNNWRPVHSMLGDHRVGRFLKARGYRFIQFGSWWTGTFHNPIADENRPHGFSEFNMLYLRYTILHPLFQVLPATRLTRRLDWDNAQCQRVAPQIEEIKALGEQDQPLFVFAHILVPHGPYNFTADGRCLTRAEADERGRHQGYIDQAVYASQLIEELVSSLQANDRASPIIMIQADEGPFPERRKRVPWNEAPADELRIKTSILNAYYFPNGDYDQITDGITPVNSYRALFNTYFGTNFPLLPDRVYVSPDDKRLYEFHDVTEIVRTAPADDELPLPADDTASDAPMALD